MDLPPPGCVCGGERVRELSVPPAVLPSLCLPPPPDFSASVRPCPSASCCSVSDSATLSLCLLLLSPPGRGGIQLDMGEAGTKSKELGLSSRLGGGAQSARDAGPLPPGPLVPVEGSRQGGRGAPRFPLLATVWCPSHQSPPPSWGSSLPAPSVHLGSVRLPACPHTPCLSSSPSPPCVPLFLRWSPQHPLARPTPGGGTRGRGRGCTRGWGAGTRKERGKKGACGQTRHESNLISFFFSFFLAHFFFQFVFSLSSDA